MSNYFIADMHFGHNGIHTKFRNIFKSQEEHDETIHRNILSCAGKNANLYLLGDTFLKSSSFWRLAEYAKVFQQVNIILGNHCASSLPRYALQFKNVNVFGSIVKFGYWLSHVPVHPSELNRGMNICGHMHTKKITVKIDFNEEFGYYEEVEDDRYFCVSCENINYTPISLDKIKEITGWK